MSMAISLELPTLVQGALIGLTLSTIGGVGAQLREQAIELMAMGDEDSMDAGLMLYEAGNEVLGLAIEVTVHGAGD
jgi:hypothetical protein